jgi:hypothetical protein
MIKKTTGINLWLFIVSVSLFVISCEYKPKGVHEVKIDKVSEIPGIDINLNFASDTLYLPLSEYITFRYSSADPLVRSAYMELNQKQLSYIESNSGSFTFQFNSNLYEINKPYIFKMEFFRSSGSGSLADVVYQEGFVYSLEITLIFVEDSKLGVKITKIAPENGTLKINWEKFKGVGFKKYHVFNGSFYKVAVISDPNQTYCYDPSSIGYGYYWVVTEAEDDTYSGPRVIYHDINLAVSSSVLSDRQIKITWIKNKYPENLAGYRIYRYIQETGEYNEIAFITNPQDTTLECDLGVFAVKMRFYVKPVAKINDISIHDSGDLQAYAGTTEYFKMGDNIHNINWNVFAKSPDNICYYPHFNQSNTVIYRFNSENQAITDSIQDTYPSLSLSPDGNKLLIQRNGQIEILNPNMVTLETITPSLLPEGILPSRFFISNSSLGVLVNSGNFFFYDFQNKTVLKKFIINNITPGFDRMRISADGNIFCERHSTPFYTYFTTELYKLENDTVNQIWTAPVSFSEFDPNNNNYFLYFSNRRLYTISLDNLSTVKYLDIPDDYIFDIDWSRNEILSLNEAQNQFSIRSIETGSVKTQIDTRNYSGIWDNSRVYLCNKTLFFGDTKLQLDYQ